MMNLEALKLGQLAAAPYHWGIVPGILDSVDQRRLAAEFPKTGFQLMRRRAGSDKRYEAWFRAVKDPATAIDFSGLSPAWVDLIEELASPAYRGSLCCPLGVCLDDHLLEITLWRYGADHFLGPHTDIASKRVAHLFYFNDDWNPAWGGCLRILGSPDIDDVVHEVSPELGTSVIILRSENSWHAVQNVKNSVVGQRRVLQVSFWKEPPRQGKQLPGLEVLDTV